MNILNELKVPNKVWTFWIELGVQNKVTYVHTNEKNDIQKHSNKIIIIIIIMFKVW
jgi:hypothetical protein